MSTAEPTTISHIPRSIGRGGDEAARDARRRRRGRMRILRQVLLGVLAVAAIAGVALALRPRAAPVDLSYATRGRLAVAVVETGMTRVKDRYIVSAPAAGEVSRMMLDPGDTVNEGDVIAEIAPSQSPLLDERSRAEAQARLDAASWALEQAQAQQARARAARQLSLQELDRARKPAGAGAIAAEAIEQTEFLDQMRAEELNSAVFASKVA